MKFFVMYAQSCVEEYVEPSAEILQLERGCLNSEFQFLNHVPLAVEISEDGGTFFPDFILKNSIPLISAGMKNIFDSFKIDYIFYKPIQLTYSELGRSENYWLALPPRINCLDFSRSLISEDENNFSPKSELIREAEKIFIDEDKVGRYNIFKLAGVVNQEIIVTEKFKNVLVAGDFENLFFDELEG